MHYLLTGVRAIRRRPALETLLVLSLGILVGAQGGISARGWYFLMVIGGLLLVGTLFLRSRAWGGGRHGWGSTCGWWLVVIGWGAFMVRSTYEALPEVSHISPLGQDVVCDVLVIRPPTARDTVHYRIEVRLLACYDSSSKTPDTSLRGQRLFLYGTYRGEALQVKHCYRVKGRLVGARDQRPGFQRYLLSHDAIGVIYSRGEEAIEKSSRVVKEVWSTWDEIYYRANCLRIRATRLFDETHFTPLQADILRSICLGDRSVDAGASHLFRSIGVAHVLAVSGFHVGVVVSIVYGGLLLVLGRIRRTQFSYPLLWGGVILSIWGYAFLCGLSIPTVRASLMFTLLAIGQLFGWQKDRLYIWSLSALLLLLIEPYLLFDVGFQLTFVSVLGIIVTWPQLQRRLPRVRSRVIRFIYHIIVTTLIVQLFIWPLIGLNFSTNASWLLLSNLLISPLVSLIIPLGLVVALCAVLGVYSYFLVEGLALLMRLCSMLVDFLGVYFSDQLNIAMPWWIYVVYYLLLYGWFHFFFIRSHKD